MNINTAINVNYITNDHTTEVESGTILDSKNVFL
jgi:hypothetical protein